MKSVLTHFLSFEKDKEYTWCVVYRDKCTNEIRRIDIVINTTEDSIKEYYRLYPQYTISAMFRSSESDHLFTAMEKELGIVFNEGAKYDSGSWTISIN